MARTAKQRAALRKAQLASARKRRGKGKGKLAKANRSATRSRRIAAVAATGGLALAAAGVAGAYYARKTAGGGPKAPKLSYGMNWVGKSGRVTRISPPKRSVDPGFSRRMGKTFTGDPGFSMRPSKPFTGDPGFTRRVGAPRSGSVRGHGSRIGFDRARYAKEDRARFQREDAMWRAKKKRGLLKNTHSKAKYRRRNAAKAKKK